MCSILSSVHYFFNSEQVPLMFYYECIMSNVYLIIVKQKNNSFVFLCLLLRSVTSVESFASKRQQEVTFVTPCLYFNALI